MKNLFTTLCLMLASLASHAQITLEHEYTQTADAFLLSTKEVKYVERPGSSNQVQIYNANHSLYRTVAISLPAGSKIDEGVALLSDKLFNSTPGLEMLVYIQNAGGGYTAKVIDESGAVLLVIEDCYFAEAINTATGTKLLAALDKAGVYNSKVYGLPGTAVVLGKVESTAGVLGAPYPNPMERVINLPYSLQGREAATLQVLDMSGRVVKSYSVGSAFKSLQLQSGELSAGIYTYRVLQGSEVATGHKFAVR